MKDNDEEMADNPLTYEKTTESSGDGFFVPETTRILVSGITKYSTLSNIQNHIICFCCFWLIFCLELRVFGPFLVVSVEPLH